MNVDFNALLSKCFQLNDVENAGADVEAWDKSRMIGAESRTLTGYEIA